MGITDSFRTCDNVSVIQYIQMITHACMRVTGFELSSACRENRQCFRVISFAGKRTSKAKAGVRNVQGKVKQVIHTYEKHHALRWRDVCAAKKVLGTGNYRKLTPNALLRIGCLLLHQWKSPCDFIIMFVIDTLI